MLKNSQDLAWHASVLEGMATLSVVEAWTAGQGLVRPILATEANYHIDTCPSAKLFVFFQRTLVRRIRKTITGC